MNSSFGQLLRECRIEAKLNQKDLGQKIHIDGSMISRFEGGKTPPNPATLQEIINALALHDVPREKLDQLWETAGYSRVQIEKPVSDPIVVFIQQEFEKLDSEEKKVLSDALRSDVELLQAYFSARKISVQRKSNQIGEEWLSLRKQVERRNQSWYMIFDEALGDYYHSEGRYADAEQYYESALWSARQLNNSAKQGEILIELGDTLRRRGGQDWEVAYKRYDEAKQIFENQGDRIRVADCLRKIACVYLYQGQPKKALPLCDESLTICQEMADNRGISKALQHKTWACDMLGRWDEATRLCEDALAIVKETTSNEVELIAALRYLGDAYRIQRQIRFLGYKYEIQRRTSEAEETYKMALAILQKYENVGIKAKLDSGITRLGLAKVYLRQPGREGEARAFLNKGLQVHLGLGEDFRVADFLSEQGSLLLKWGRLEEAENRLQTASDRFRRLGNNFHYANTLASLCELYYEKKDGFEEVYHIAQTAREIDNGLINYHLAKIEFIVGKAYIDEKQYVKAAQVFHTASEKALNFNYESFGEIFNSILDEIERVAQEAVTLEEAIQLCNTYIRLWENREIDVSKQKAVHEAAEAMRQKQKKLEALRPI